MRARASLDFAPAKSPTPVDNFVQNRLTAGSAAKHFNRYSDLPKN
jgi:hypothetical protein